MTVAVLVKVFDGLVLATDSASTFQGPGVTQVYNNANKLFHLHRELPLAAMTWGLGNIGSASNATIAKDLRVRLMGEDPEREDWTLNGANYTVREAAERARDMLFELYVAHYGARYDAAKPETHAPDLGFLVAGYSAGAQDPEAWRILIGNPVDEPEPDCVAAPGTSGWLAYAQTEAAERLFYGIDPVLAAELKKLVRKTDRRKMEALLQAARQAREPVLPAMPFVDAIDLARYIAETTIGYSHHLPGSDTVGGPIDVAGVSRHEGFKWISRKHYFNSDLNPQ